MRRRTIRYAARRLANAAALAMALALPGCDHSETSVTQRPWPASEALPGADPFDEQLAKVRPYPE